jgi:Ankyrin repeats (many copies)
MTAVCKARRGVRLGIVLVVLIANPSTVGVLSQTAKSQTGDPALTIKAQTVIVVSHGSELALGRIQTIDLGNGAYSAVQPASQDTVWVFRDLDDLSTDTAQALQEAGISAGKAYIRAKDNWKLVGDVDPTLTNEQIAMQFGIQLPMSDYMRQAFLSGDLERVRSLLNEQPGLVSHKPDAAGTPLSLAVWRGHKEVVELLLAKGADVNARDTYGQTPLSEAVSSPYMAEANRLPILELLLAHGADISGTDSHGKTPVRLATENGRKEVAEFLRQHGGRE